MEFSVFISDMMKLVVIVVVAVVVQQHGAVQNSTKFNVHAKTQSGRIVALYNNNNNNDNDNDNNNNKNNNNNNHNNNNLRIIGFLLKM